MNKVILMGRLVRDPEVRYTSGEKAMAVANYTLAVDRRGSAKSGQEQAADFIRCVAFDKAGEFAEKYFRQGQRVLVSGHIQTNSYQNRDGKRIYTTDVIIETQEFADSKGQNTAEAPAPNSGTRDGFMSIPDGVEDEGLPFS